ncbi:hypothetical protein LMG28614_07152 [Paraburkholderia ultramafica]|uniref:Cyclic nucleotide-binding domain-containing protein n=1 Tax=Paraburkholderia ultramafica TaxID=1544867 RepID=A0A6S7BQU0_9BURK|nr:mechanosensitive ion channel family protein [Paraburkholderia ultramafica]CAB3809851.1 hypothetical protein LMG28614_07152 [Paraburkholderia ultramafica]
MAIAMPLLSRRPAVDMHVALALDATHFQVNDSLHSLGAGIGGVVTMTDLPELSDPLAIAAFAAACFVVISGIPALRVPFLRTVIRLAAFCLFTIMLLRAGLLPSRPVPSSASLFVHGTGQLLIALWWFGGASVLIGLLRASRRVTNNPARQRLIHDIVATVIYIVATLEVCSNVFGLPVGTLLATSGAIAIVVGLALQSTLGDVFSGLVLNLTRPYTIGDWIVLDATLEGRVVEMHWRATHIMTLERNVAVVPNSVIAKTRFINTSQPAEMRGANVRIQLRPDIRPQFVITALTRAVQGCIQIAPEPPARITIRTSTVDHVEYEVYYFTRERGSEGQVSTRFLDIAYQHLASLRVPRTPVGLLAASDGTGGLAPPQDLLGMFDDLTPIERDRLADHAERHVVESHTTLLEVGEQPGGVYIVESGVLSMQAEEHTTFREIGRLNPGDHWGDVGATGDGVAVVRLVALCASSVWFLASEQIRAIVPAAQAISSTRPATLEPERIDDGVGLLAGPGTEHRSLLSRLFHGLTHSLRE